LVFDSLFGFHSDGRKDTSIGIVPTAAGYDQLFDQAKAVRASGKRLDRNDPSLARLAEQRGKTVDALLSEDFGQY